MATTTQNREQAEEQAKEQSSKGCDWLRDVWPAPSLLSVSRPAFQPAPWQG